MSIGSDGEVIVLCPRRPRRDSVRRAKALDAEEEVLVTTMVRWIVVLLLSVHALIHLLGAATGFGWIEASVLRQPISAGVGAVWLVAAVLVLCVAVMIAVQAPSWWWCVAITAAVVS